MALTPVPAAAQGSVAGDRTALEAFYDALGGDNWESPAKTNWKDDSKALGEWSGITTNAAGRVTRISMTSSNFRLIGSLPTQLGDLSELRNLLLSSSANNLTGTIPAELGNLSNLRILGLGNTTTNTGLTGAVPAELGRLSGLLVLSLQGNSLEGTIPTELSRLSGLFVLNLQGNSLEGTIPTELGNLSELEQIRLDNNRLTGEIPAELGMLSKVQLFNLSENSLTGEIPAELGNLGSATPVFREVKLSGNSLTGCWPSNLRTTQTNDREALGMEFCATTATVVLTADEISEDGGTTTVTATLNGVAAVATTLEVSVTPVAPAVEGDVMLSANTTLSIAKGAGSSTGTVTVTAVDNDELFQSGKALEVHVRATSADSRLDTFVFGNLMIADDEQPPPRASLVLTPSSITENGGTATVTAMLEGTWTRDMMLTVSAAPVTPATAGDFTLSANKVLTIAMGQTSSTGTVTITAVDNDVLASDKTVTVSAVATGSVMVPASQPVTLTIADDEVPPTATLVLSDSSIAENGGAATVTATLDRVARAEVTLTVSATPGQHAVPGDFTLNGSTLTIAAGSTTSTGVVTITAVDNDVFSPSKSVTVSAMLPDGLMVTAPQPVTLTIENDEPEIEWRDVERVLAGAARSMASDAVEVLAGRFDASSAGGTQMKLGGHALRLTGAPLPDGREPDLSTWRRAGAAFDGGPGRTRVGGGWRSDPMEEASWRGAETREFTERDLLTGSSFELPLSASGGDGGSGAWAVWGRGAASGFGSSPEPDFSLDGRFYSGYLGLEMQPQPSARLGLAVAHTQGTVEYERTGGTKAETDVKLTSVLPYMHWQPRAGLGLWGLFGAGAGDMEVTVDGASDAQRADLTSYLGAVGGRQELSKWRGMDLAVKADAFAATLRSEEREGVPGARGDAGRVRMAMEGSWEWPVGPDSRLSPRVELGGRWDGGTAERGLGVEVGGGFAYTQIAVGLSVEAQGRYLVAHQASSFDQWGASLSVSLDPGVAGRGASLTVAPVWGQAASGTERLWSDAGALDPLGGGAGSEDAGWTPQHLDVALAYGLPLSWDRGRVTPYGGMTLGSSDSARYRLGSRLTLGPSLDLSVEGVRTERHGLPASHGVSAQLGMRW